MFLQFALMAALLLKPEHSHDLGLLTTWEGMRTLPGYVVAYESGTLVVRHEDKYSVRVVEYRSQKNVTVLRVKPDKRNALVVVLFCPKDNTIYTVIVGK